MAEPHLFTHYSPSIMVFYLAFLPVVLPGAKEVETGSLIYTVVYLGEKQRKPIPVYSQVSPIEFSDT